jgi:hypothetical protein
VWNETQFFQLFIEMGRMVPIVLNRERAMDRQSEEQIRARAHELWEQAGKPKGREDEFWLRAERELSEERIRHELKTPDNL